MQHIFGIILSDNDAEIIDDESPGKGSYMGLAVAINKGRRMMSENPSIRQVNIYRVIQGQRMLDQQMFRQG